MDSSAGLAIRAGAWAAGVTFGTCVLASVLWLVWIWIERRDDERRARELRELLVANGRLARVYADRCWELNRHGDANLARTLADIREACRAAVDADNAARDARAIARLRRDLGPSRRPPLVAVPDQAEAV